jgi:hypothetical protein
MAAASRVLEFSIGPGPVRSSQSTPLLGSPTIDSGFRRRLRVNSYFSRPRFSRSWLPSTLA